MQIDDVTQSQVDNLNYDCTMIGSFQPHITGLPKTGFGIIVLYPYIDKTKQNGAQEVFYTDGERYWRKAVNDSVSPWYRVATATPPQEYDLPLADGITNYATSVYHKNQFNEVSVRVSLSATNAIQNGATIATLPEGFRPAKAIDTDATGYVSGSSWFACRLVIQPSGAVQVYWGIGSSTATFIVGSFEPYLAVN